MELKLKRRILPDERRRILKNLLDKKGFARILEAHNGLSAIIANNIKEIINNEILEFDGFWASSFTDSAAKGYPDIEIIGVESRYETIRQILNNTNKPMIIDGDTGGEAANFEYFVRTLEDMGVSMVIIEDKKFPKRNSLESGTIQDQEDPEIFATKIKRGKEVQISKDFMIVARIESLISGSGLKDAIFRAKKYLLAGADGIMIHSKDIDPKEILDFAMEYNKLSKELGFRKPLVCVPTTYNTISEDKLQDFGFNIVIYANHLLRAAHKAMKETASIILRSKRAFEAESMCSPVKTVFKDVGFLDVKEKDMKYNKGHIKVIIPAAGTDPEFDIPKAMTILKGKPVLQRQIETLKNCGINDITVIRGFKKEEFSIDGVSYIDNNDYDKYYILHSLFKAEEQMEGGFLFIYSDILFNEQIIKNLLTSNGDIILALDNSYTYHKHKIDKNLELILTKNKPSEQTRDLYQIENEIIRIGRTINMDMADYEFTGIAYFSEYGVEIIRRIYNECKLNHKGNFHEADSFGKASFIDLIQEVIDRGFRVDILEVHKGWFEIHNRKDIEVAERLI
ncbi:MAG: phosphoenolpyruvate mutase [Candidatus Lokiarchaeota archaeon]|nr:phosphoenolpyruvate mutase [Candidatus Lokiarchaeota archaeon]